MAGFGRRDDAPQKIGIALPGETRHQGELAIPAPAGMGTDRQQLDLAVGGGADVEPGIVAAAEPGEEPPHLVGEALLDRFRQLGLPIGDLARIGRLRIPFRGIGEDARQGAVELRVVDLEDGKEFETCLGVADDL